MQRDARIVCRVDGRGRGTDIHGGQPAGVAVSEDIHGPASRFACCDGLDERQAGGADGTIERDIFIANPDGEDPRGRCACADGERNNNRTHAIQRPAQVHGGRPRRQQRGVRAGERRIGSVRA